MQKDMSHETESPIKLLVIDIDGTLLNPDGEITLAVQAAIQAARQAGIIVTLATARRYCNTIQIADALGLDIPLIMYDGAMIVQHPQRVILHKNLLPARVGQQAVDLMVHHHIQPVVHPDTGLDEQVWTGPPEFDNLWQEAYFSTFPEQVHRMPFSKLCAGKPDPVRVVAFAPEDLIRGLYPGVSQLDCAWNSIRRGSYGTAELVVMNRTCSKASGVETLAKHFGIAMNEVMAIGDNNNDIEMLQAAGWGVAMGHAPEAVKAAANAVTATNREDGVAQAIERFALPRASTALSNSRKRAT
jgi:hydroxymethylpyrimidine pyrophosphatase-like HAD family hydrolase